MTTMKPVKSSAIHSVGYERGALLVKFTSGKVFRFLKVPEPVYTKMLAADSVGKFFGANVRGKFKHEEMRRS